MEPMTEDRVREIVRDEIASVLIQAGVIEALTDAILGVPSFINSVLNP